MFRIGKFSINGQKSTPEEYEELCRALTPTGVCPLALRNGKASKRDIVKALGRYDEYSAFTFADLNNYIKRHGISQLRTLYRQLRFFDLNIYGEVKDVGSVPRQHPLAADPVFVARNYFRLPGNVQNSPRAYMAALVGDWRQINLVKSRAYYFRTNEDVLKTVFKQKNLNVQRFFQDALGLSLKHETNREFRLENYFDFTSLLSNKFLAELVILHFEFLGFLTDRQIGKIWPILREYMRKEGLHFPPPWLKSYQAFREGIKSFTNIPEIFRSFKNLYIAWSNSQRPYDPKDKRPVALILHGGREDQGAFLKNKIVNYLIDSGKFRVLYRDSINDADLISKSTFDYFTANKRQYIQMLVLSGHGSTKGIALNITLDETNAHRDENNISVSDIVDGEMDHWPQYLSPNGRMILWSCSTGGGGKYNQKNLPNRFKHLFPPTFTIDSSQAEIFPSDNTPSPPDIFTRSNGEIIIKWSYPYSVNGTRKFERKEKCRLVE